MHYTSRLILLIFVWTSSFSTALGQQKLDSLKRAFQQLDSYGNTSQRATIALEIAHLTQNSLPDTAAHYAQYSLEVFTQLGVKKERGRALLSLAMVDYFHSDWKQSIDRLVEARTLFSEAQHIDGIHNANNLIANAYVMQGKYQAGLNYYFENLKIAEAQKDSLELGVVSNNIAIVFYYQKDLNKAMEFYQQALDMWASLGLSNRVSTATYNIGLVLFEQEKYQEAAAHYQRALAIAQTNLQHADEAIYLSDLGWAKVKLGAYQEAEPMLTQALKMNEQLGNTMYISYLNIIFADLYQQTGRSKKAARSVRKGMDIAQQIQSPDIYLLGLKLASPIYEEIGAYQKAYSSLKEYKHLKDSLLNEETYRSSLEKEFQHKEDKRKLEETLKEEQRSMEREKETLTKWLLFGGIASLLVLLLLAYRAFRIKSKAFRIISTQKNAIESQKREIDQQNNALSQLNEELYQQQEELVVSNEHLEKQRQVLENTYLQLKDTSANLKKSIEYASHIQEVVLPTEEEMLGYFSKISILFKPKDIVSGDFYWFSKLSDTEAVFAVADCTGHGVPGAFMSMMGSTFLHETINVKKVQNDPARVLKNLHSGLRKVLRQAEGKNDDGMDIAICYFKRGLDRFEMAFAGAKSTIYVLDEGQLTAIKGDRQYIGGKPLKHDFSNQQHSFSRQARIYMFSDGFIDQHNSSLKKIGSKAFREILEKSATLDFHQQKELWNHTLELHQGYEAQRDDICIVALQV